MFTVWRPLRMRPTTYASINAASATDQITGQHYHISPLSRELSRQPHRRQQRRHNSHSPVHLRFATTLGTTPGGAKQRHHANVRRRGGATVCTHHPFPILAPPTQGLLAWFAHKMLFEITFQVREHTRPLWWAMP